MTLTNAESSMSGVLLPLRLYAYKQIKICLRKSEPTCGHKIWVLLITDRQMHVAKQRKVLLKFSLA